MYRIAATENTVLVRAYNGEWWLISKREPSDTFPDGWVFEAWDNKTSLKTMLAVLRDVSESPIITGKGGRPVC